MQLSFPHPRSSHVSVAMVATVAVFSALGCTPRQRDRIVPSLPPQPIAALRPCAAATEAPASWPRVTHRGFSFAISPAFRVDPTTYDEGDEGMSFTLLTAGGYTRGYFQYGSHAQDLTPGENRRDYQACSADVGGRVARVATWWEEGGTETTLRKTWMVGVYWDLSGERDLVLFASTENIHELPRLEMIVRSARLPIAWRV